MTETSIGVRRWVGKLVLLLGGVWALALVAVIGGAVHGAEIQALNVMVYLTPGCAFVPGAFYAIKLHRTSEPDRVTQAFHMAIIYGIAGAVLLVVAVSALSRMGQS